MPGDVEAKFAQSVPDFRQPASEAKLDLGFDLQSDTLMHRVGESQMRQPDEEYKEYKEDEEYCGFCAKPEPLQKWLEQEDAQ